MTKPKPFQVKTPMGRKSHRLKNHQDKLLKMFFSARDLTPWQAAICTGCGYDYALKKFREFRENTVSKNTRPDFYS